MSFVILIILIIRLPILTFTFLLLFLALICPDDLCFNIKKQLLAKTVFLFIIFVFQIF